MTTITITAKKSAASSTSSLNDIQLVEASVVQIRMPRSQIKGMKRVGDDLVVTSAAGEVITVHGFFTAFGGGKNDLVIEDPDANGALWLASLPDAQGELVAGFQSIDSIEPLLLHESFDFGVLPWIAGAGLLAGAAVGGGGGGGGKGAAFLPLLPPTASDTTPPAAPVIRVTSNAAGAVVVTGQAEAGSTVSVNFPDDTVVKVVAGSDGSFSATSAAGRQPGGNVVAHATDPSGNQGPDAVVPFVMRDIDAPVAPSVTVNNGAGMGGKGEPGSTVTVTDDKGHTTTTTVDKNGDWKVAPNPMAEGQSGTITATDPAGNVSPPVSVVGGDHTAPVAPTVTVNNGAGMSGTGESGSTVTIKGDNGQVTTATVDKNGDWKVTPNPVDEGQKGTVTATDQAGNVSPPVSVVGGDHTAPPAPTVTENNGTDMGGTGEPGSTVTIKGDNGQVTTATVDKNGDWKVTPNPMAEGQSGTITATDPAGNVSPPVSIVGGDHTPPVAPTIDPTNGSTVSGTAEPDSIVTVKNSAGDVIGSAVTDDSGHYTVKPGTPSSDGDTLSVVSTDKAGNPSTPATVTVDGKAPQISVAIASDTNNDGLLNAAEVKAGVSVKVTLVSGAAVGDVITAVGGATTKTVTLSADDVTRGSVSIDLPAPTADGPYAVTVKSKDLAGNESTVVVQSVVDTVGPVDGYKVAVVSYFDNVEAQIGDFGSGTVTNDQTPLLKGSSSGLVAGDFLHIYEGTTLLGNAKVEADGSWSYQLEKLPNNVTYAFHAVVVDAAGNEGLRSADFSFKVAAPEADLGEFVIAITGFEDHVSPSIGTFPEKTATNDPTPVLRGLFFGPDQGDYILIYENGVLRGTATILADQKSWEFKLDTVPDGAHAYVAELFSGAGDKIIDSDPFQLVVDTHAPVAPSITVNNGTGMGGKGEPGSTATVTDDKGHTTTTTVDKNGDWKVTPNPVDEGQKGTVTVTDPAGNVSPPVSVIGGDHTAPPAPTVTENNGAGMGGTGEPGSTVTIKGDNGQVTTATVDKNGDWKVTPNPMAEGQSGTITATDPAGNVSPPVSIVGGDHTAPPVPTVTENNGTGMGGTGEPGSTVTITDGKGNTTTTTVDKNGDWKVTPNPVDEGQKGTVTTTDPAGNVSPPVNVVGGDHTAPLVPTVTENNGTGMGGTGEPGSTVTITDGKGNTTTTTVDKNGDWKVTPNPVDEGQKGTVTTTDPAGNVSPPVSVVGGDHTAPPAPTVTENNGTGMGGTGEPGSTVTITDGKGNTTTTTVDKNGDWKVTPNPVDEGQKGTVTVTDPAGNVSPPVSVVGGDHTAPPAPTVTENNGTGMGGTGEPGSTVTITDGKGNTTTTTVDKNGDWKVTPNPMAEGQSGTITATDPAGNVSPPVSVIGGDHTAPVVPTVTENNGAGMGGTGEPGSTVTITDGKGNTTTTTVDKNGDWKVTPNPVDEGQKGTVTVTDPAGNVSPPVSVVGGDHTTPPAPTVTENNGAGMGGTGEPGSTVTVTDGKGNTTTTTVDKNGDWKVTPNPVDEGQKGTVTVTDPAGNVSPPVNVVGGDHTAPLVPTVTENNGTGMGGTGEPGSTVTITDGKGNTTTTTVDKNGDWKVTPNPVDEGQKGTVTVTDPAGNVSPPVNVIGGDHTAPPAPTVTENNGTGMGGTGEPGSTVTITDGKGNTTTSTVDKNGDWKVTPNPVDEGQKGTVTVTDPAGNVSPPVSVIGGDHTPPIAPTIDPTNGNTVSGTAEPDSIVTVKNSAGNVIGSAVADGSGHYTIKPGTPSIDGDTLSVVSTDKAGNPSTPATVTVDGKAPQISVAITSDTNNDGLLNAAEVKAGVSVKVTLVSGAAVGDVITAVGGATTKTVTLSADDVTRGSVSIDLPAPSADGPYAVTVKSKDLAGNESTVVVQSVVDTVGPVDGYKVAVVSYFDNVEAQTGDFGQGTITNDQTPLLKGTSSGLVAGDFLHIYEGTTLLGNAKVGADGAWSYQLEKLPNNATHSFHAVVVDAAGNEGLQSADFSFKVAAFEADSGDFLVVITAFEDNVAPNIGLLTDGKTTNDPKPVLHGVFSGPDEGDSILIHENGVLLGTATILADKKSWEFKLDTVSDGAHTYVAELLSGAGDKITDSDPFQLVVDTHAPSAADGYSVAITAYADDVPLATGDFGSGTSTNDTKPLLKGTVAGLVKGDVVQVFEGTTLLGTASVNGDAWTLQLADTKPGLHTYSATIVDAAGNAGISSAPFTLTVDTTAPGALDGSKLNLIDNEGAVQGTIKQGDKTDDSKPEFKGIANPSDVASVNVYDGDKLLGNAPVDKNGNWSFTPDLPLAPGAHSFNAQPVDAAGNVGQVTSGWPFTLLGDAPKAPAITAVGDDRGILAPGASTKSASILLQGTGELGTVVTVYANGNAVGSGVVSTTGTWVVQTSPLTGDGVKTLKATAVDIQGRPSPQTGAYDIVLDTTAPAQPAMALATDNQGAVKGAIVAGGTTDDATPAFSGSGATAGDLVRLYDGKTSIGSTAAAADGSWSFTPSTPLGANAHSITLTLTDAAGNTSIASTPLTFSVDTSAVVVSISKAVDNFGAVKGDLASGAATDDAAPTLVGTATAGAVVTVSEGTTVLGSTTADADGSWSLALPKQGEGLHAYTATAVNAAGTKGDATFGLTIDLTAPAVPVVSGTFEDNVGFVQGPQPSGATTDDTTPGLSGSGGTFGDVIKVYDNGSLIGSTAVDKSGNWSFTPRTPLTEAEHKLTFTAVDLVGNESKPSEPIVVNVDLTAPKAKATISAINEDTGTSSTDFVTSDNTLVVSATVDAPLEAGAKVQVSLDDGRNWHNATLVSGNTYAYDNSASALPDSTYSFQARVVDAAGNPGATTKQAVVIDSSKPTSDNAVAITSYADDVDPVKGDFASGTSTNDIAPLLKGTVAGLASGDVVQVFEGTTLLGTARLSGSAWSLQLADTPAGAHTYTAKIVDAAGNVGTASAAFTLTVDTTAPGVLDVSKLDLIDDEGAVKGSIPQGGKTDDSKPEFKGVANASEVASVNVLDNGTLIGSAAVNADGTWSFTPTLPLKSGAHSLTAQAVDAAGNVGAATSPWGFTLLGDAPKAPAILSASNGTADLPPGASTNDTTPTFRGTGEAGTTVTVYSNGSAVASVAVAADGTWSVTTGALSGDGLKKFTAIAVDEAGRASPATGAYEITLDTKAPDQPAVVAALDSQGAVQGAIAAGGTTDDTNPAFSGTGATAGDTIKLYDGSTLIGTTTPNADGSWSFKPGTPLGSGAHSITLTLTDKAGNTSVPSAPLGFTVDTSNVVVSITNAVDAVGSVRGNLASGGATDDTAPKLEGTATAGATVTVKEGAALLGSTTAGTDGKWSFVLPTQAEGLHTYTATATNAAGTNGNATFALTIDTTPPAAPTVSGANDDVGLVQGPLASGAATDDTTPTFSGKATAGNTVNAYDGASLIGSAAVDKNGNWSFTPNPALTATEHQITFKAVDPVGNESAASAPFVVNVNLTPSSVKATISAIGDDTGTSSTDFITSDNTLVVSATVDAKLEAGAKVQISLDNGKTWNDTTLVGSTYQYDNRGNTLADNSYTFQARVVSAAGVPNTAQSQAVVIDSKSPTSADYTVAITAYADDTPPVVGDFASGTSTNDTTPVLKGTVTGLTSGDVVKVFEGTTLLGTASLNGNTWSFVLAATTSGMHTYSARIFDAAGNAGNVSKDFVLTVDVDAPTAPAVNPSNGNTIGGTAEPGSNVVVKDATGAVIGSATADSSGNYTVTPAKPPADGTVLNVTATDAAGNASKPVTTKVDALAPDLPTVNATNGNTIAGTAEPGSNVVVKDATGAVIGSATADSRGNYTVTPAKPPADGTVLNVTATDAAGNASKPVTTKVDALAPDLPTVNATNGNTIGGTAEPGSNVVVKDATGAVIGSATADGSGNYTVTPAKPPADGTVLNVTATDAAGNASKPATTKVDALAPDLPTVNATNGNTIAGTAEPGSNVVVKDATGAVIGSATADSRGNYTVTPAKPPADGTVLNVTATDAAGNASKPVTTKVDAVAPELPTVKPTNGQTITGTAEGNSTVVVKDSAGNVIGSATVGADGKYSITPTKPLGDGAVVSVTATDAAGNASKTATATVDALPPTAPTVDASNGKTITGTAEPDSTVVIKDGQGNVIGSAVTDGTGKYSITPVNPPVDGAVLNAVATDKAGNPSPKTDFIVDGKAPTAPLVDASNGKTITGTAEPDSTVVIKDGKGNVIGSAVVDGTGKYSITPATQVPDNTVLSAVATDKAGNPSPKTDFTVDGKAPPVPKVDASNGQLVTGSAEPGSTVVVKDSTNTAIGSAVADATGKYSIAVNPKAADKAVLSVTATDAVGNASDKATVTVDAAAPPVPKVDASNGQLVTGSAEPGSTVVVKDSTNTAIGSAVADATGKYSVAVSPKAADKAVLSVTATDAVGNASDKATVTVDAAAPPVPKVDASNGQLVTGSAEPGSTVVVKDSTNTAIGSAVADATGKYSIAVNPKAADKAVLSVTATDAVGNASDKATVTVDAAAPPVPKVDASNGQLVTGSAEPGSTVVVKDSTNTAIGSAVADATGKYSIAVNPKAADKAVLNVTATDAVGNASDKATVTVDAAAPPVPKVDASNGQLVTGSAEPGSTVVVKDSTNTAIGSAVADATGKYSIAVSPKAADKAVLSVTATDAVGNASDKATVTVDGSAPEISIAIVSDKNGDGVINAAEIGAGIAVKVTLVSGAAVGDVITVTGGAAGTGTTKTVTLTAADVSNGSVLVNIPAPATDGPFPISVTSKDLAGNANTVSQQLSVDTTGPIAGYKIAITVFVDDQQPVVGEFKSGSNTDDTTPMLKGTVSGLTKGDVVQIFEGSSLLGTAIVAADGSWTYQLSAKTPGAYTYTAKIFDAAGNPGLVSDAFTLSVVTAPPTATAAITAIADDTGLSASDFITSDQALVVTAKVTGTVGAGEKVQISLDNGVSWNDAKLVSGSTYQFDNSANTLKDGSYTFQARVVNGAGIASNAGSQVVVIDHVAPSASDTVAITFVADYVGAVQGDFPSGARIDDTRPLLRGTVTGLVTGEVVQIFEGTTLLGMANVLNNTWTYQLGVKTPASYTYTAKIVDVAGNVGVVSTAFTFTVDTTTSTSSLTSVSIITDTNDDGVINAAELNGSATVGVTVKFAPGNVAVGDIVRVTDGITTNLLPLKAADKQNGFVSTTFVAPAEGQTITVTATITNAAGNSSTSLVTDSAVRHTVAPTNTATIDTYTDDVGTQQGKFGSGTYTDDTHIVLNGTLAAPLAAGETVTAFAQGILQTDPRVPVTDNAVMIDATHWTLQVAYRGYPMDSYFAKVTNTAGNDSPLSPRFTVNYVLTSPSGTITVDPLVTVDTTPTLSGKVTGRAANESVTVMVDGVTYKQGDGNLTVTGSTWKLKIPDGNAINLDGGDDLKLDVVASIVNTAGVAKSDTTAGELTVYRDITISPLPDPTHVTTSKPALIGAGHVGANESLTVQVLDSRGTVIKSFQGTNPIPTADPGTDADPTSEGALSFNGFGGWSISDSNWGDSQLTAGKYTVKAFTTVADGSGGQVATDSAFTVVDSAVGPRTMVATPYSDTAPKAYALGDGGYMLFYTSSATPDPFDYNLYAQRYGANGLAVGDQIAVAATPGVSEALPKREDMIYTYGYGARVKADGSFNVFYTTHESDGDPLNVKNFDNKGAQTGATIAIKKPAPYTFEPNYVQMDNGDYAVVMTSGTVHYYNLYALRFKAGTAPDSPPLALTNDVNYAHGYINAQSWAPVMSNGGYFNSENAQGVAAINLGGRNFLVQSMELTGPDAYSKANAGPDIVLRTYNFDTGVMGTVLTASTKTAAWQIGSKLVSLKEGGFASIWVSNADSAMQNAEGRGTMDGFDVYARRFTWNGQNINPVDTVEQRVNTVTDGTNGVGFSRQSAQLGAAALEQGGYVVVWARFLSDSSSEIYSQSYDAAGNKRGAETLISTDSTPIAVMPDVIGLKDGGYMVSWTGIKPGTQGRTYDFFNIGYSQYSNADILSTIVNADGTLRSPTDTSTRAAASYLGGTGTLTGTDGVNTLDGHNGAKVMNAGGGDDTIIIKDTKFTSIDGGNGTDVLVWNSTVDLKYADIAGKVKNIEVIQLGDTGANKLILTTDDVLGATGTASGAHTLVVRGGAGDSLALDTDWSNIGMQTWRGDSYTVLVSKTNPDAVVWMQSAMKLSLGNNIFGTSALDTITDTTGNDVVIGLADNDVINLTQGGHDTLMLKLLDKTAGDGGNGFDDVYGFTVGKASKASSDVIDLHELLIGYTKGADASKFVQISTSGDDTYVLIDRDGDAGTYNQTYVLTLHGVQTDLATLLANNQLVLV